MKTFRIEIRLSKDEWNRVRLKHSERAFRHILLQACMAEVRFAIYSLPFAIGQKLKAQKKKAVRK